ncbi:MAG: response regulator, partial [Saprospiraceae bacterium]|nr:response regulator [Saprospiraceae bacterium]
NFNEFLPQNHQYNPHGIFHMEFADILLQKGKVHLFFQMWKTPSWYQLDPETDRFRPVSAVPAGAIGSVLARDRVGNLVFVYKNAQDGYQAILQDTSGRRFDYTACVRDLADSNIETLRSNDFTKQVLVCSGKGISAHRIKATQAIQHFLPNEQVRAMAELPDKRILVSCVHRFYIFDPHDHTATQLVLPVAALGRTGFYKDPAGDFWTHAFNNLARYDPASNTYIYYPCQSENIRLFVFLDPDHVAIVDRTEKLYIYQISTQTTRPFLENGQQWAFPGYTNQMILSHTGLLWVTTTAGLWKIDIKHQKTSRVAEGTAFGNRRFLCIYEDVKGRLWLGTTTSGLYIYHPESDEVVHLNSENGLANNTVASIIADDDGVFWVNTYNGISLVSEKGELIANIYENDGLVNRENNRYAALKTSDGKLLIGTTKGLNYIDPKLLKSRLSGMGNLQIYLTGLQYFDGKTGKITLLQTDLNNSIQIELPAEHRFLNVNFALSNYFNPEANQYAYMLEGIDKDWTSIGTQHRLSLNNLPVGRYRLLVKGRDRLGNWTPEQMAIQINARAFFYQQLWFYAICFLILAGVSVLWITRLRMAVKGATEKIRKDKALIEQQADKLKELDEAKSRFFTNISHEFRTPLTIISGMVDQVKARPEAWLDKGTRMIKQNAVNLLNLVNQILDLRKLESGALQMHPIQGDIVPYLRYIAGSYQPFAQSKGLQLHFLVETDSVKMDYDPDKILRIVSNLLSNAVKYTPEGGHIYLQIDQQQATSHHSGKLLIRVKDTGAGIAADELPLIFDRFFQANDSMTRKGEGTGIGLALTRELVQLMQGEIEVSSEPGKGTNFLISLPITLNSPIQESFDINMLNEPVLQSAVRDEVPSLTVPDAGDEAGLPSLLVVDDNPDILQFIAACLEGRYQLHFAHDGQQGIDLAIELTPDLIVSDVMMPETDGYTLCDTLKRDERTSHIPIILLTAKADLESRITGLEKGADAYLAKPFEEKELLVRLAKLLELRQKLQERYAHLAIDSTSSDGTGTDTAEDAFLQRLRSLAEANLSDPEFDMTRLSRALGMSRSQVFRKVKALTGDSPTNFIRNIRLHAAKNLLEQSDLNISEVAYETGFSSLNYFSAAFFEKFGIRPSAARK